MCVQTFETAMLLILAVVAMWIKKAFIHTHWVFLAKFLLTEERNRPAIQWLTQFSWGVNALHFLQRKTEINIKLPD